MTIPVTHVGSLPRSQAVVDRVGYAKLATRAEGAALAGGRVPA